MYFTKAGIATAARMPRIATTIMSSIRVNPRRARVSARFNMCRASLERFRR